MLSRKLKPVLKPFICFLPCRNDSNCRMTFGNTSQIGCEPPRTPLSASVATAP